MERHKPLQRRKGLSAGHGKQAHSKGAARRLGPVLSAGPVAGLRFQSAQRLGPFMVDFICPAARLVILLEDEGDGARTEWLSSQGYRVLAFTQREASNPQTVLDAIARMFELRAVPPRQE